MNRANLAVLALIVLAGCQAPKPTTPTTTSGGGALAYSAVLKQRSDAFQRIDTNHDCVMSHAEFVAWQNGDGSLWANYDRDGNGYQTAEEWLRAEAYAVSPCKGVSPPASLPPEPSSSPQASATPSGSPSPGTPPPASGGAPTLEATLRDRLSVFKRFDADHDCAWSQAEWDAWQAATSSSPSSTGFANQDEDKDGRITAAEWMGPSGGLIELCD
jgi:hypothetical protein